MHLVPDHRPAKAIFLLLLTNIASQATSNASTISPQAPSNQLNTLDTCEFRTINYITASLPQLCYRSSWSSVIATSTASDIQRVTVLSGDVGASTTPTSSSPDQGHAAQDDRSTSVEQSLTAQDPSATGDISTDSLVDLSELNESSFLSFEEWKKQALEKAGQVNSNIGGKRQGHSDHKKRDLESIQNHLDSMGEEGEIDIDFGIFRGHEKSQHASQTKEEPSPEVREIQQENAEVLRHKDTHRSKDAGITCKERFSYASFDAGATVLKTHPGAKNAKAVLIENKDSYMLSECSAENKFIIIELSEDIWIDTVVLANYEFFSSMVRTFRVSVSDRYPVKMEKWKEAGTYEARNSRDIQAFLIENPQIWARYIRIEFLSHYGKEYYCPLSLVRVHGTRMLESWKETEASGEDEDADESESNTAEDQFVPDAVAVVVQEEERINAEIKAQAEQLLRDAQHRLREEKTAVDTALENQTTTPWMKFDFTFEPTDMMEDSDVCLSSETSVWAMSSVKASISTAPASADESSILPTLITIHNVSSLVSPTTVQPSSMRSIEDPYAPSITSDSTTLTNAESASAQTPSPPSAQVSHLQNITTAYKNKTATATSSSPSSLPTIQESFFKAVSRRLQLLESNSTLSLGYIEEQSKILREAFAKVEKKQLQKTTSFLDTLNGTVLSQLQGFRQQYDEIWQSTVISLESQREESRKEILAISSRLNILADEVVFQKRMSIVQSVLLLLCLGLVIFSRVSAGGPLDFPNMYRTRTFFGSPLESPLQSPSASPHYNRHGTWLDPVQPSSASRSRSRDDGSPPTPYSGSDANFEPSAGDHDVSYDYLDSKQQYKSRSGPAFEDNDGASLSRSISSAPRSRSSSYGEADKPFPTRLQEEPFTPVHPRGSLPASHIKNTPPEISNWRSEINILETQPKLPSPTEEDLKPLPALLEHEAG